MQLSSALFRVTEITEPADEPAPTCLKSEFLCTRAGKLLEATESVRKAFKRPDFRGSPLPWRFRHLVLS